MLEDDWWCPYKAHQTTTPNGFLWVASMSALHTTTSNKLYARFLKKYLEPLLTLWICDAFLFQETSFAQVSWMKGVVPFLDSTPPPGDDNLHLFDSTLWIGEAVRWLAETVMLPTTLLPESGMVTWKKKTKMGIENETQAIMELAVTPPAFVVVATNSSSSIPIQLTATFDSSTGLLTRLQGERPYLQRYLQRQDKSFIIRSWVGLFGDYQWSDQAELWYPSHVQAGWMMPATKTTTTDESLSSEPTLSIAVRAKQTQVEYQVLKAEEK